MENCKGCRHAIRSGRYLHWREYVSRFGGSIARSGDLKGIAVMLFMSLLLSCGGGSSSNTGTGPGSTGGVDTTPPAVAITSPASGGTVSGSVGVTADATDNIAIAGVQFQLDGADFGAELTVAPHAIILDTSSTSNGLHTLGALARDGAGNRTLSQPVSVMVSNALPPPGSGARMEETEAPVRFSGAWSQASTGWFAWSGGSAAQSATPGARATFSFSGTSVTWIGYRDASSGIARVLVDGVVVSEVDLFARGLDVNTPAFTVNGLSAGNHTLTIEATGLKNPDSTASLVVVDAFDVPAPVVSHLQETDPIFVFTGAWVQADDTIAWSGGGVASLPALPVGGARLSSAAGATVTLTFRGTGISWSGARMPGTGIASVSVDGGVAQEIDTYSPSHRIQDTVFRATGLADAIHTLTIVATGRKNAASSGAGIVVDAVDVTTPGRRYQEEDSALAYSGDWIYKNPNRTWSEGTMASSNEVGASVTFSFTGTSVSWIGCRKLSTGNATVYLDNVLVGDFDTYLPEPIEAYQTTIYRADNLPNTAHTLRIVVASTGYIVVDAFDVRP